MNITSFVIYLLFKSWKKIYHVSKFENFFINNRTWLIASIIATTSHLYDVTYYDGKISIIIWIFLAGLKCIIEENYKEIEYSPE